MAAIGRSSGLPAVSPTGAATYTIPLWVPPGINGLQPSLALVYSSHRGEGPFGVGWGLAGLSVIERCVSTWAQNGVARDVRNDNLDRFCLDGNQLRLTGGTYGANGSTYQTEIETYARVKAFGSAGNGPAWFFVEGADGLIYEYGNTTDSRIESVGQTTARAWALNKIRDRAGNEVLFSYTEDTTNGSYRIAAIEYTRNAGAGVSTPRYKVEFVYETLPVGEVDAGYLAGSLIKRVTRVDRIDVTHDASLVRRYELSYEANLSNTGKSRLASFQECSGSLDCFPATVFTYQNGTPGLMSEANAGFSVPTGTFPWSLDVNGNGLKDLVYSSSATSGAGVWMVAFANGSGGYQTPVNTGIPNTNFKGAIPIEFNNDGREDLLVPYSGGTWWVMLGTESGLAAPVNTGAPVSATGSGVNARAIDIDGDGYEDLVWAALVGYEGGDAIRYRLRIPGGNFSSTASTLVTMPPDSKINNEVFRPRQSFPDRVPDFNGDGRGDIAYVRVDRVWNGFSWNYITTIQVICPGGPSFGVPNSNGSAPFFGDFNGDGRTDLMYFKSVGSGAVMVRYSTGTSFTAEQFVVSYPSFGLPHLVLDWNGDGRHDLLALDPATGNLAVYRSTGESFLSAVNTGVNATGMGAATVTDINGDGLADLVYWTGSGAWKIRRHSGVAPDLLATATDAFGVTATFTYGRLTDPTVHTRSSGAVFPEVDVQPAIWVVKQLTTTDGSGTGATWNAAMSYQGARSHRQGRGFLGFRLQTAIDNRLGYNLKTESEFEQSFPFTGLPKSVTRRQSSGTRLQETSWSWSQLSWGTPQSTQRLFPYASSVVSKDYELSGTHYRTAATSVAAINSTSGLITDRTTTVTEIATGLNPYSYRSERVLHSSVFNDTTNWCLGRPQTTQVTASHSLPDGAGITRTVGQTWSGLYCRPTQQQLQPGDPALQVTLGLGYDNFGNLASQTVTGAGMAARTTTLSWGARGQFPESVTNPLSQTATQAWNFALGVPSSATDPNGLVTSWLYDGFGRLTRETRPDATRTDWVLGTCSSGCDPRSRYRLTRQDKNTSAGTFRTTTIDFDQFDRPFRTATEMPGGAYALVVTESDARGRLTREYVPYWSGGTQQGYRQLGYDLLDRVTADRLHAAGGAVQRQSTISHTGLSSTVTDPRSQTTTSVVTGWGDLAQVVDAAGGQTRYRHDGFGQLTQVTDALNNVVLSIGYNMRGMKISQSDINMGSWSFQANALGELTHIRDAKTAAPGWTTIIGYDALSRMTTRQDVAEGVTSTWSWGTSAAAKNIGRLAALSGGGYAESYSYDSAGRLSSRVITADTSYTYSYAYNNLGALHALTFPVSTAGKRFKVKYGYDRGYPSQLREFTDDVDGVLLWSLTAVDAGGRPLDEALGTANGVRVISGFDPVTGLIEYRQAGPGGNGAIQHFAYEWDAAGNLTRRADLNQSGNCSGPGYSGKLCESFGYDALERLISSQRNGVANLALQYDLIGNLTSKTSATDAQEHVGSFDYQTPQAGCSYYGHSQRHAVRKAGSTVYCYDANGNMISRGGQAVSYTSYNLPAVINGAGASSQFWYTPERRRWQQVAQSSAGSETTIQVGGQLEKVTRPSGTEYRHYVAAGSVRVVVTRSASGQAIRYLPADHLGSVSAIIDQQGAVLAKLSFSAFGARRGSNWTGAPTSGETSQIEAATRSGYTGHDHLDNLALIHMHGRVYDPRIGRFLSRDPLVADPGRGQDYNGYAYVRNGPLRYTDPTGWQVDEMTVYGLLVAKEPAHYTLSDVFFVHGGREARLTYPAEFGGGYIGGRPAGAGDEECEDEQPPVPPPSPREQCIDNCRASLEPLVQAAAGAAGGGVAGLIAGAPIPGFVQASAGIVGAVAGGVMGLVHGGMSRSNAPTGTRFAVSTGVGLAVGVEAVLMQGGARSVSTAAAYAIAGGAGVFAPPTAAGAAVTAAGATAVGTMAAGAIAAGSLAAYGGYHSAASLAGRYCSWLCG